MKILLFILFILISVVSYGQELEIKPKVFNFGTIKEVNGVVTATFEIKNVGKKPYIMNYSYTTCGCIATDLSKKPLMPGKSRTVKINFDPMKRPGTINKEVVLVSSNYKQRDVLKLSGNVIPRKKSIEELYPHEMIKGVKISDDRLPFGLVAAGREHATFLTIYNPTNKSVTLSATTIEGGYGKVELSETVLKPKNEAILDFAFMLDGVEEYGIITDTVYLTVDGERWRGIAVSALALYDIENISDEERANAPTAIVAPLNYSISKNEEVVVKIGNTGKSTLKVLSVVIESGEAEYVLQSEKIKPNKQGSISLKLKGRQASVSLLFNDPLQPIVTIRLRDKEDTNIY